MTKADRPKECFLYRHFDSDGVLLYVGVSWSVMHRLTQHKTAANWFPLIRTITIVPYTDRQEAIHAEMTAINNEKPLYNKPFEDWYINTGKRNDGADRKPKAKAKKETVKKEPKDIRSKSITIPFSFSEKVKIIQLAKKAGVTTAEFARSIALRQAALELASG